MHSRYVTALAFVVCLTGCDDKEELLKATQVVEGHRAKAEAKLRKIGEIASLVPDALDETTESKVIATPTELEFWVENSKRPFNASVIWLEETAHDSGTTEPRLSILKGRGWEVLRVREALKSPPGKFKTANWAEDAFQKFERLRYLVIVREVEYQAPKIVSKTAFEGGVWDGDILVFDILDKPKLLGGFPITVDAATALTTNKVFLDENKVVERSVKTTLGVALEKQLHAGLNRRLRKQRTEGAKDARTER